MNSLTTSLSYNFFFNLYIQTWIRSEILLFFTYFIHYHFLVFLTSHMSILYNKLKSNFELQVLIFVLQRDIVRRNNIFVIFRFVSLLVLFFFCLHWTLQNFNFIPVFLFHLTRTLHSLCNSPLLCSVPAISFPFVKTRNFNFHHSNVPANYTSWIWIHR